MISTLGQLLIHAALIASAAGIVVSGVAAVRDSAQAHALARRLAYAAAAALTLATGAMEWALITHDFSVSYVAEVGSLATPPIISVVSLWSSLDGSILFWALVLALYQAAFAWRTRDAQPRIASWALVMLQITLVFFTGLVVSVATPFAPLSPAPLDGPGPNALLQNHLLMAIHPPTLYLGYVGMAVPFAMAMAALLTGRLDAHWMRSMRAWSLWVWSFLTLGILLGGWWSYEVLGWGGYWAWDPVENASLLPWLTLTAAMHSLVVTSRRRRFRSWTLSLIIVSFLLTLLGTFMTRSGVFNSVHSFTQSPIGPLFLSFIAIVLVGSLAVVALRLDKVEVGDPPSYQPVSREVMFLLNNLLLSTFAFTVLYGSVYPLVNQAIFGSQISVGGPYFERFAAPLSIGLLALLGVGPSLSWGRTGPGTAARQLAAPVALGLVAGVGTALAGVSGWGVPLAAGLAAFIVTVSLREMAAPVMAALRKEGGTTAAQVARAWLRSRRRQGAHIAHIGTAIAALAITASSSHKVEGEITIEPQQTVSWEGYDFTFTGDEQVRQSYRINHRANLIVRRAAAELGAMEPSMNYYATMSQPLGTPAVMNRVSEDLYLSVVRLVPEGSVTVRAYRQPLVVWLWIGGMLMVLGAALGAWPKRDARP
ncbi:MAG: heme lyase CcmF/NrfE family subunit [Deltaproteobacteria bacterium]|nr:heme lyase CcmF/NrfE family subunit [Deltaproteobacteria bacterium]